MQTVIVGPGALGCLLAARLCLAASSRQSERTEKTIPWLLDYRADRADRLASTGILLEEDGNSQLLHPAVSANPEQILQAQDIDLILLCVKAGALPASLEHIAPLRRGTPLVAALQNGIGHLSDLRLQPLTALGTTSEGATMVKEGHVRHAGSGLTLLGFPAHADSSMLEQLKKAAAYLKEAGFKTRVSSTIEKHIWAKLFINIGINALSAIHGRPNGQLLISCAMRSQIKAAVLEAVAVAKVKNIPIETDPVKATFAVCRATRNNISSMLQDVRSQRPTEIHSINGAIVAEGRSLGISTPVNQHLLEAVCAIESAYQKEE